MKKIGLLLLVLVMLFSFTSCKSEESISEEENINIEDMTQDELFNQFVKPLIGDRLIGYGNSIEDLSFDNYVTYFQSFAGLSGDYLLETYEAVPRDKTYNNYDEVYVPFEEFKTEILKKYNLSMEFLDKVKSLDYIYNQEKNAVIVPVNYALHNKIVESNVDKESIKIEKEGDIYKLSFDYHYTANIQKEDSYEYTYHYETYTYTVDIISSGENYLIDSYTRKINKNRLSNDAVQTLYLENIIYLLSIEFSENEFENLYTGEALSALITTLNTLNEKNLIPNNDEEIDEEYDEYVSARFLVKYFNNTFKNAENEELFDIAINSKYYNEYNRFDSAMLYTDLVDNYVASAKVLSYTIDENILTVDYILTKPSEENSENRLVLELNDTTFYIISNEIIG